VKVTQESCHPGIPLKKKGGEGRLGGSVG